MADYDVGVTELSSPPPSAVKTTYRPAVRIRNNGIHDALASGILRIYSAGRLIFTTEIYSTVIPPKETREAQAVNYWTPETEGSYLVIADATCPLDQVETNNHLSPTTVIVGPGEVPVPPIVTQHAAQHEEGGTDQISIDGLRGEAYDPQPPKDHVSRHEQGGSDELSVGGLHGQLADAQPTEDHGNEHHTKTFETVSGCTDQIGTHNSSTAPHPGTTNLEYVERKGAANGYAPLDADSLVPTENLPPTGPSAHASTHEDNGDDEISIAGLSGQSADAQTPTNHGATHGNEGGDDISIGGLSGMPAAAGVALGLATLGEDGVLSVLQRPPAGPPPNHGATHGNEGGDDISISGLSGIPAAAGVALGLATLGADGKLDGAQMPLIVVPNHGATHGNEGGDDISIGGLSGIPAAAGVALGLATLDALGKVPTAQMPAGFSSKVFILETDTTQHTYSGNSENHLFLIQMSDQFATGDHIVFRLAGSIAVPGLSHYLTFLIRRTHELLHYDTAVITVTAPQDPAPYAFNHEIRLVCRPNSVCGYCNFSSLLRACNTDANTYPWNPADPDTLELLVVNELGCTTKVEFAQVSVEKLQ